MRRRPRTRRFVVALAGLAGVIVALAALALVTGVGTRAAADRTARAIRIADVYQRARFAVGDEESLERKYRLEPSPGVRDRYEAAASELEAALGEIRGVGDATDGATAQRLLEMHRRYLTAIRGMFAAVDARDTATVLRIDRTRVDPLFDPIQSAVQSTAAAHRAEALGTLATLQRRESSRLVATLAAFGVGLVLLAVFALMLMRAGGHLRHLAAASEHDALHDALTGLPNRRLMLDRLQHTADASSGGQVPFSVLAIDLDGFKEINDTLGYPAGDALLAALAPRLQAALRPGDTVARMAGDEFSVLLPGLGSADATGVAERLLGVVREPIAVGEIRLNVDACIGIASGPEHGNRFDLLLQRADVAMHLAKTRHGAVEVYDPGRDPHDTDKLLLAGDLRRAVADDELVVHYQPKYDLRDMSPVGAEALVRWAHPERGMVPPDAFIPIAERTGLIRPLTQLVLRKAARQCRAWAREGLDLHVAVNISVASLSDDGFAADVRETLMATGLDPGRLELEITESTIMADPQRALRTLRELADMGIRLSIDDFGTGHSSLAYLRTLPVSEIKIDRSFVRNLAACPSDQSIVRSTVDLVHSLGLAVVAEGVEDAGALEILRGMGCDTAQGYHMCRPVPPPELTSRLVGAAPSGGGPAA
ncbi:MAG: EAL domain-containing protein [Thermoleophilia bacterium]